MNEKEIEIHIHITCHGKSTSSYPYGVQLKVVKVPNYVLPDILCIPLEHSPTRHIYMKRTYRVFTTKVKTRKWVSKIQAHTQQHIAYIYGDEPYTLIWRIHHG